MINSVSVDIHTDHRPGHDFAKWGVHPTSPLEQRTPNRITGDDLGGHHMTAPVRFTGWIGGVAVFNRAWSVEELSKLAAMVKGAPIPTPTCASR